MKTRALQFLITTLFCLTAAGVWAGDYKTVVITPSTTPLLIDIPPDGFMLVRNFTQEGVGASNTRGLINVQKDSDSVDVLAASLVSSDTTAAVEVVNSIVIAGKATVTISCPSDATNVVMTYRKTNGSN